jgi:hypothetical protein
MGGQLPQALKAAQEAVAEAEQHAQALTREYAQAFGEAVQRERVQLAGRPAVYAEGAVLVRLSDQEASLRKQLQAATVAVTEARTHYQKLCAQYLIRPGGSAS